MTPLRVVLFAGKGGVGKTTVAAATAALAGRSAKVLLASTDPAHSLADTLGVPLGPVPQRVGDLYALQLDPRRALEQR